MRFLSIILSISLNSGIFLLAQSPGDQIQETTLKNFRNKIDSLPWFIAAGLAVLQDCNVPGHRQYFLSKDNIYLSQEVLNRSKVEKENYIRMFAIGNLASQHYSNKDYVQSTILWQKALVIALRSNFSCEELHHYRPALNNNCFLAGNYTQAMQISSDGLAKSEDISDTNRMIHFNNVIGYIHMRQKNFAEAEQYFSVQMKLSRMAKDSFEEAHALYNLADLSLAQEDHENAINFLRRSGQLYDNISHVNKFIPEEREAYISNKMAEAYKLKGNFTAALQFSLTAVTTAMSNTPINSYERASYFINAGDIYNRLHKPDSAIFYLRQGMEIAKLIIHREYIRDASEQLAIAFGEKEIFDSAYLFHASFYKLKDSIDKEINQQEILQREANRKIEQQRQLQRINFEQQKLWRNIIIVVTLFSLITLGFLYNRYRLRQKNRYQEQVNRQQNELFNAIAVTQDQERKRIAEDIHDSLGSILSAAKLKLSGLREEQAMQSAEQRENWQVALQLLDEASTELRNISHNIMPATLSKLGLVAALRNLFNSISSHSIIKINFSSHDLENRLDEHTEMSIYRIVLELINNIVKHAQATKVTVQLIRYPDYINLSVEDNGRGFNYDGAVLEKKGIGLGNVLSRVEYLKGKMDVDSTEGKGTTIIIDFPYSSE